MEYNVKVIFYDTEIQISRYHYNISNKSILDKTLKEMNKSEADSRNVTNDSIDIEESNTDSSEFNTIRSLRRTKQTIYELLRANHWDFFGTFTFKDEFRYDYVMCKKKFRKWLDNLKQRFADDLLYLGVPEMHKDGAWHFHVLIQSKKLESFLIPSYRAGRYVIPQYKLGRHELEFVNDSNKVSSYITKYITKELSDVLKNKQRYISSKGLNRPNSVEYKIDDSMSTVEFMLKYFPDYVCFHSKKCEFNGSDIDYLQLRKRGV